MPTKAHACQNICQPLTPAKAFAFLDTDHDGLVSVDEIAAQMQSVMRVTVPADEIRSICKVSLSKNPKGLTMEDFTFLVCTPPTLSTPQRCVLNTRAPLQVHWKPALEEGAVVQDDAPEESSGDRSSRRKFWPSARNSHPQKAAIPMMIDLRNVSHAVGRVLVHEMPCPGCAVTDQQAGSAHPQHRAACCGACWPAAMVVAFDMRHSRSAGAAALRAHERVIASACALKQMRSLRQLHNICDRLV